MTIVTPCQWLKNLIKQSFLGDYPIKVIYNGIDKNIFKPTSSNFKTKYRIENKNIILGVASEWTERKGLKDFIKLNERINKNKYVIVIVGVDKKQIGLLPKDIVSIMRTENVKELVQIYSSAFVFFNPTHEDNFPTTNLEAQACGTPVITYDTGGSSEAICNKNNVVKKNDIESVMKRLNLENDSLDVSLNDIFTKENMIKMYEDLYYE